MLPDFLFHHRTNYPRIAVVGIGNELNGDDAAGVLVARRLQEKPRLKALASNSGGSPDQPALLVLDTGPAPESFTGPLRRFQPDLILLVDAAELGELPGAIRWFEWDAVDGMSGSTHTLPPSMFARFLMNETGCHVMMIGIQPRQLDFDAGVSREVMGAVETLSLALETWLGSVSD